MRSVKKRGRGGRTKGTLNKATVEVKALARELVEDPTYLKNLKKRLAEGALPPGVEMTLWAYAYNRPPQGIEITGLGGGPVITEVSHHHYPDG